MNNVEWFMYIYRMIKFLIWLFLAFPLICFAQTSSSSTPKSSSAADSQMSCPSIELNGMQTTENIPYSPDKDKWKLNKINIEGIVDSVGSDTFFVDGKYAIRYLDSTVIVAKIIKIKNVKPIDSQNDMKLAFDSNAVYVPLDLNIAKDDSIFIKDYSVTFFLECYTHTNLRGRFMGEFFVNEFPETMGVNNRILRMRKATSEKHNRNAAGKFLNTDLSKIIKY